VGTTAKPSKLQARRATGGQNRSGRAGGPLKLLHAFPTFAVGGAQTRFALLADALGQGFEHVVVSGDGNQDSAELVDRQVQLRLHPIIGRKGSGISLTNLRIFRSVLRDERPDLLLTYNWGAIEWALADRIRPLCPHLHVVDGFGLEEALAQLPRRIWLRRLALSGRTAVVVPSETLRRLATESWRLDPGRVHLIPNGVDAAALDRQALQPMGLRRQAGERLIGTLAGLRPEKNLGRLLRIAALLPIKLPWRLVIAGEGSQRAELEALARELGLAERVVFTGLVDRPGSLLGELDVYVLTSDTEQMPISVLEAMAVGRPVLATDVGDLRRMLPPASRDACLFGRDQEPAFAARLTGLLTAPDECRRLGAANRDRAAEFSLQAMVASYERLLRILAAGG
jgi:glycosyltransferase involved in cell wall biosynthesis